jgi:geranylgeranyl pyrophosphate synthase
MMQIDVRQHVLGLTAIRDYPGVRLYLEQWLDAREQAWAEFADLCFRIAGGRRRDRLARVLSGWLILFSISGPLDDYADEDKATGIWRTLGRKVGSSVSLAMIAEALGLVMGAEDPPDLALCRAASIMTRYLKEAALGQAWDNAGVKTLEEYERMLELKAATLLAALAECVAVISEADAGLRCAMASCGRELGMAVQIVNDYLGIWKPEAVAKQGGGDLAQPQLTYPMLYALEVQHPHADEFQRLLGVAPRDRDTARMLDILNSIGARQFMRAAIELRRARALQALEGKASPEDIAELGQWCERYLLGNAER